MNIFSRLSQRNKRKMFTLERQLASGEVNEPLKNALADNLHIIKNIFEDADDLIVREFEFETSKPIKSALLFLEGMVDADLLYQQVLSTAMTKLHTISQEQDVIDNPFSIVKNFMPMGEVKDVTTLGDILNQILAGSAVLLLDSSKVALAISAIGWQHRGVQQPASEAVVRGPREGFTESIKINLTLIRRRLKDPNLKIENMEIGRRSKTIVALVYVRDIIDPGLLDEARKRLQAIDIDVVNDSGYIEQMISDSWWSPFSTTQETERPDEVAAALAEGRFAILSDNSPFAILAPTTINTLMQSPEDYYLAWMPSSLIRLVRFIGSFMALILPSLYIALVSFHPEMIPADLALSIAASRVGIPFIAAVETILMEASLELLREAGIRLPGPIGQTIGIVGGLIIGEAAVTAGLVSPLMVIVVALTAIASFMVPTYSLTTSFRNLRFLLMFFSACLGLFGLVMGMLLILIHLATLKSFGVSMLAPWSPLSLQDFQDTLIRFPYVSQKRRPSYLETQSSKKTLDKRNEKNKRGIVNEKKSK